MYCINYFSITLLLYNLHLLLKYNIIYNVDFSINICDIYIYKIARLSYIIFYDTLSLEVIKL